jgi:hypothetical protein
MEDKNLTRQCIKDYFCPATLKHSANGFPGGSQNGRQIVTPQSPTTKDLKRLFQHKPVGISPPFP